jgi:hypothetical protein
MLNNRNGRQFPLRKAAGQTVQCELASREYKWKTVFLSHRFADEDYVSGLIDLLKQNRFRVVSSLDTAGSISRTILEGIRESDFFLCVMTRDQLKADGRFTTSPWLLEEKGAALAFGKPLVLMIEEGVAEFGNLQGDGQCIHFGTKGFLKAALQAVNHLKTFAKQPRFTEK